MPVPKEYTEEFKAQAVKFVFGGDRARRVSFCGGRAARPAALAREHGAVVDRARVARLMREQG